MKKTVRPVLLSLALVVMGCSHGPALVATRPFVETPAAVRVALDRVAGNTFTFAVYNLSGGLLTIDRNGFVLTTAGGPRQREPGGILGVYNVPPGGVHQVKVRYNLEGLNPGEQIAVAMQGALTVNGQPVAVEPITFTVQ